MHVVVTSVADVVVVYAEVVDLIFINSLHARTKNCGLSVLYVHK